ncbi:MAG: hypothetical protein GC149_03030 [Gammaproteobacteria bacterium]|nr:hypothetical protein [Gammaproteobacteria bacterium]
MSGKKTIAVLCAGLLTLLISNITSAEEAAPKSVIDLAPSLQEWGHNAVLVAAVKEQNAKGITLDTIKKADQEWMAATGVTPFMKAMMENPAAKELKKLEASKPYFDELFLMDNQGANVAMTNKTSDYWQGDEDKFTESYKGGQGAVHIGKVKFDKSSQAYLVQVSVPVMDGGKAIGAITIGINVDELEKTGK